MEIYGICVKRFKSTSAVKQKNQPQIYANQNLWKSAESALEDLKSTLAVKQKNQSQIYANPNL